MKLAAIYNVWDGVELLRGSMLRLKDDVDIFIIVFQNVSNFGEHYRPLGDMDLRGFNYVLKLYNPEIGHGAKNETAKRNIGIQAAREYGCTHFLHLDCDEYYENFSEAKKQFIDSGFDGSVCRLYTYFKNPTLRFSTFDNYYVPFIHELKDGTVSGYHEYPYYVDPTRKINCDNAALITEPMHHFSYVRKDIEMKVKNSSARVNIEKSQLLQDYRNPDVREGFYVTDFRQKLIEVPNIFNIQI
jgi:hypothetical protein